MTDLTQNSGEDYAIRVAGLVKTYGAVRAVDGIDFTVPRGGVTALLGGNGAGKTSTIAMILGLLMPSSGEVNVLGVDMVRHRHRALGRLNFSSPYVELPARLTPQENLNVFARLYGLRNARDCIAELAEKLDIAAFMNRPCKTLSSGQKTRVALAKALLNAPDVLLLDEPTASLDPDTADWVRGYLEEYQRASGASILFASHHMGEVERLADDVLIMRKGRIEARGSVEALKSRFGRDDLEAVFLDVARCREMRPDGTMVEAAQ